MSMTLEQAMAKATKLLRLAESSNAHEAALAAQMAQKILARYNIDQAALAMDSGDAEIREPVSRDHDVLERESKRMASWKGILAMHVAEANSCRSFSRRGFGGTSIILVGRATDVERCRYLYHSLAIEVDKLTLFHARGQGHSYATSFRLGVVSAIGEKLREAHASVASEMRAEATTADALARINKALARVESAGRDVDAWVRENMNVGRGRSSGARDGAGFAAGQAAGRNVNVAGRGAIGGGRKLLR